MTNLTPRRLVEALDAYIVGQDSAKQAVAVAVRNRWRRQRLSPDVARDVAPKNILMIGPTGVGKTEIARRLATLVASPFVKIEATKFTEVGYHGRDVESMVRDLVESAIGLVREEMTESVREIAERRVEERLLDELLPAPATTNDAETESRRRRTREKILEQLRSGALDGREVQVHVEQKPNVGGLLAGFGTPGAAGEVDPGTQSMFEQLLPTRREARRLTVAEARKTLFAQEADKLIDKGREQQQAIERAESSGIIFLDELDKIAASAKEHGPDVSRQGVQRDLLPIVEGSTVTTKYGPCRTDHVLFIAAGAFHQSKPSDLMPELQGRFPIRVELTDLTREDFIRILTEPRNAVVTQQVALLATEGLTVTFSPDALEEMAAVAYDVNRRTQNVGARRLHTILERVIEHVSFDADERVGRGETSLTIDRAFVRERLGDIAADQDLSHYVL